MLQVGNCYFVSSVAMMASRERLYDHVIGYDTEVGVFACCMFISGRWCVPILDDFLPARKSKNEPSRSFPIYGASSSDSAAGSSESRE